MAENYITCQNCGTQARIPELSKASEKLRREYEAESRKKEKEFEDKMTETRVELEKQAKKHAEELLAAEIRELKSQLEERSSQLEEAIKEEVSLRKCVKELEERGKKFELKGSRDINKERKKILEEVSDKITEEHNKETLEKDKQIAEMQRQIEELRREAEKGSGQSKGESKNLRSEDILLYLSGEDFRERIKAIVDSFTAMNRDLNTEKLAMERIWAKREKEIQRMVQNAAGMYGDIQGIIGTSLPDIKTLEMPSGGESGS